MTIVKECSEYESEDLDIVISLEVMFRRFFCVKPIRKL